MTDKLLNIGPKSAAWLRQVGVRTHEDLQKLGAVGTFLKVKRAGFRPSLNLLYALAGAEQGCHWTALTAEQKSAMVLEVSAFDDAQALAKKRIMPVRDMSPPREEPSADEGGGMAEPNLFDDPEGGETGGETGGDSGNADSSSND